jgi:hypothetical protein
MSRRRLLALSFLFAASSLRAAPAVIALENSYLSFYRTSGTGEVTLIRSGDLSAACSVQYHVSIDAEVVDATASFAPKEQYKYIYFPIPYDVNVYDNRPSSAKNYFISIGNPVGAVIGSPSTASIYVFENEPVPVAMFQSTSAQEGNSGITLVPVTITLSAHLLATAYVDVYAIGGTAQPGTDYEAVGSLPKASLGQVRFDAFQTTGLLVVRVKGDQFSEPDETILIGGGMPTFIQSQTAVGTLTILNDDYILTPGTQRIARGTVGSLSVATSVPTPTNDRVLLSSSDPSVAAVPPVRRRSFRLAGEILRRDGRRRRIGCHRRHLAAVARRRHDGRQRRCLHLDVLRFRKTGPQRDARTERHRHDALRSTSERAPPVVSIPDESNDHQHPADLYRRNGWHRIVHAPRRQHRLYRHHDDGAGVLRRCNDRIPVRRHSRYDLFDWKTGYGNRPVYGRAGRQDLRQRDG